MGAGDGQGRKEDQCDWSFMTQGDVVGWVYGGQVMKGVTDPGEKSGFVLSQWKDMGVLSRGMIGILVSVCLNDVTDIIIH